MPVVGATLFVHNPTGCTQTLAHHYEQPFLKNMKNQKLPLILLLFAMNAYSSTEKGVIVGAGTSITCNEYIKNPEVRNVAIIWVQGWLSGNNSDIQRRGYKFNVLPNITEIKGALALGCTNVQKQGLGDLSIYGMVESIFKDFFTQNLEKESIDK